MADLPYLDATLQTKIVGGNPSTGVSDSFMEVDTSGRITAKITDSAGLSINLGQTTMALSLPVTFASNQSALSVLNPADTMFATQNITTVDVSTTTTTVSNGQVLIIGTPTVGSAAIFALNSVETGQVQISGIFTGTLQIETSLDGLTYVAHSLHQLSSAIFTATFTQPVLGSLNLGGKQGFRVRAITAFTGTAIIRLQTSVNATSVYIANSLKLVDTTILSNPITMNIAAASTAVNATQTAMAVGLSPNSPLPTGTNSLGSLVNISGTISLPTGASTATNQATEIASLQLIDNIIGTVAAGTAGTNSALIGGIFNTTIPTLTNTQQAALQLDSRTRLSVLDIANLGTGIQGAITVTTTATEVRVGAGRLANRSIVTAFNNGVQTLFWGYTSAVTTITGTPLVASQIGSWRVGDGQSVYLIATSGSRDVRVTEV